MIHALTKIQSSNFRFIDIPYRHYRRRVLYYNTTQDALYCVVLLNLQAWLVSLFLLTISQFLLVIWQAIKMIYVGKI